MEAVLSFKKEEFLEVFSPIAKAKQASLRDEIVAFILEAMWEKFLELGQAKFEWLMYDLDHLEILPVDSEAVKDERFTLYHRDETQVIGVWH